MSQEGSYDYIVIGGGIAGASVAFDLARHGSVLLLEGESQPGYHATGRSEALFEPLYGGAIGQTLARVSETFFREPPPGFASSALLHPRGGLYVAQTGEESHLDAIAQSAARCGLPVEVIGKSGIVERCPILRPDTISRGLFDPSVAEIDVGALHQGFLSGVRKQGGRIETGFVVERIEPGRDMWIVTNGVRRFIGRTVVNAAGAWADIVAGIAGLGGLGHRPLRRTVITVDAPADLDISQWPHVEAVSDGAYFKPESGRMLFSPADEIDTIACDAQPEEYDIAVAVDRLERLTTLEVRRVNHRWAGLRTMSPDRSPVIGEDPRAAGFFWLTGLGGIGIMTAPAAGMACGALIRGEDLPSELTSHGLTRDMLAPARFIRSC